MLLAKLKTVLEKSLGIDHFRQIHAVILVNGLHDFQRDLVRQILVSGSTCSQSTAEYAKNIIHHMQNLDAFLVACMIRFSSEHGRFREAVSLYVQLQAMDIHPSKFVIPSVLKACAQISDRMVGSSIHAQVEKYGFSEDTFVQTALLDFYSKAGDMEIARLVFDRMANKNVVSWNSMLAGYVRSKNLVLAQNVFDNMPEKDVVSWNSIISGYAKIGQMQQACAFFQQMPKRNSASWNTIISGYVDDGNMEIARSFFDAMPERNNISYITIISGYSRHGAVKPAEELFAQAGNKDQLLYNAMIACYAQNSRSREALQLFKEMLQPDANVHPDKMTLASALSACSQLSDAEFGYWIESYMSEVGIRMDNHLAAAFIDLYAKSGNISKAFELFHSMQKKDLVAYTSMILGCGINGRADDCIKLFDEMMNSKIKPNLLTCTGLLSGLSHAGLVEESYYCLTTMQKCGISPSADHYATVVDLLSRAGRLEEAHNLIQSMPMKPHAGVWGALLLGCSIHNNLELGETAARHCFQLEPDSTGYRSLLANIYASGGRWDDAKKLREAVKQSTYTKLLGCSWSNAVSV